MEGIYIKDLSKNDDHELEQFWYTYKLNLLKFYKNYKQLYRPVKSWSNILNHFKEQRRYDLIQKKITYFITLHAIDTMKTFDSYLSNLLKTNIKRWINLCKKHKFFDNSEELNKLNQLFLIYLKLINQKNEKLFNLFNESELFIFYKDYSSLIIFAIDNEKGFILDRLNKIFDISIEIYNLYGKKIYKNTKGNKIIKIINNI